IGVELVTDHNLLTPAAVQASYIAERMKQGGVLISTDGPFHNVLKIKPPMCFSRENADSLIRLLDSVLEEDFSRV
ncbi:MAG: aspartate aminotransferase family protein, partial [Gammaproteobacteria bacterium]|nr:aspartate aminotransferase family protein [Gammaproteobacteria bacterium]